ncbi:MAG: hypothetical protein K6E29_02095 [Cyanobacteria bacterium RUI128]|nr:hypothetical protein [Cyanobacteria bacterium RUI128]
MNVKSIGPQTKKVVSATREAVQQRTHNPVNTYEFHLGFVPEHLNSNNRLAQQSSAEYFINQLI